MSEQKDLWDKKPKRLGTAHYQIISSYDADKMDVFHEDVRAHQRDLEQIIKNQETLIEALKENVENGDIQEQAYRDCLDELKEKLDASNKEGLEHHAIAVEYYEKLEAIKDWCEGYKPPPRSFNKLNQDPFIQLEKILEGGDRSPVDKTY
ncbi:hypothetical protein LCGC14_1204600 [marine sediment metagenome]|uniref:Uncharacterized protein n=1 Tax=marine sediment metagenome TaxID=412755 RepID=A0A0F9LKB1_9ZZZZ